MKKSVSVLIMAILAVVVACSAAMAAEYTITWRNEMPPGNQNACWRKITVYPVAGPATVIAQEQLRFPLDGRSPQVLVDKVSSSAVPGCAKIVVNLSCAVKDGDVTEWVQTEKIEPCRDSTVRLTDFRAFVQ